MTAHIEQRQGFGRELLLIGLLILLMASYFWLQSRYPALNQKAMMGAAVEISAIGFDTVVEVTDADSTWRQIGANTINWMYTNKQGMTFGVLFAAALMSMLSLLRRRSFQGRLSNTLLGMLIGAPLGVCVNCAAPIGQGLYAGGSRAETTLAAMISSPTLNIVVITMLFTMFPLHLAILKLAMTIGFIVFAIPLLTRYLEPRAAAPVAMDTSWSRMLSESPDIGGSLGISSRSWSGAARWLVTSYAGNLWFVVVRTVPLMILAGFLGSALITLVPFESLQALLPHQGRAVSLAMMALLALIGAFLPVPMAFDVIVVAVLYQSGFPADYAMVLLFTLGIFSIYSFSIVWRTMGVALAAGLFVLVASAGVVSGVVAYGLDRWHAVHEREVLHGWLARQLSDSVSAEPDQAAALAGTPLEEFAATLELQRLRTELVLEQDGVRLERIPFGEGGLLPGSNEGGDGVALFARMDARRLGVDADDRFSPLDVLDHRLYFRGIASGDVHNDGWSDLVVTGEPGVYLYSNMGGKGFVRQRVDVPALAEAPAMSAALVDLDNDGWLDLYVSTYNGGSHVVFNDRGDFSSDGHLELPNQEAALASPASAFGDLDEDGDLDLVLGNWSLGRFSVNRSYESSRDVWLENRTEGADRDFVVHPLSGAGGEALTALITDFDFDGHPDLMVGNDFAPPDMLYLGDGDGSMRLVRGSEGIIPYSTHFTMSIASGDMDNDLVPELFIVQISPQSETSRSAEAICGEHSDPLQRDRCLATRELLLRVDQSQVTRDLAFCEELPAESDRDGCIALFQLWRATKWQGGLEHCDVFGPAWSEVEFLCRRSFDLPSERLVPEKRDDIRPIMDNNVLLVRDADGRWVDRAPELGMDIGGMSWNAKFADLDNDGWQDIYLVNGFLLDMSTRFRNGLQAANILYHNRGGQGFEQATEAFGLGSYLESIAYTYVDLDNDGDLDIVDVPMFGPLWIYENRGTSGKGIAVSLRDERGNSHGIGARITVTLPGGSRQMRELQASGGFLSFDAPVAQFGIGVLDRVDRIDVTWFDGAVSSVIGPFDAGHHYVLTRSAH